MFVTCVQCVDSLKKILALWRNKMFNFPLQQTCWSNLGKTFNVVRVHKTRRVRWRRTEVKFVLCSSTAWACTCIRTPTVHSKSTMGLKTCCGDYGFNERVFGAHPNLNWIHNWMGVLCLMRRVRTWIYKKNVLNLVPMMFQSRMLTKRMGRAFFVLDTLCHYQHSKQNCIFWRCQLDPEQLCDISVRKRVTIPKIV